MQGQYVFTCGACGERTVVDDGAREALIEQGCFVCGERATGAAFSEPGDDA